MRDEQFAQYLLDREPGEAELPRMAVYRRLVRAGIRSGTAYAFPEARKILGEEGFDELVAEFLEAGGPSTPYYRDIPADLVFWALEQEHPLADLMQWEWLEVMAARHPADIDALDELEPALIRPNPTMQIAVFTRAVEELAKDAPEPPQFESPLAYLVWRRPNTDQCESHRVGLILARALALASEAPATAEALAERLASEAPELDRTALLFSLRELERELREREGIL